MRNRLTYLYIAFISSFVIIIIISTAMLSQLDNIKDRNLKVDSSYQIKHMILKIRMGLLEAESSQRGYLLTENDTLLRPMVRLQHEILDDVEGLRKYVANNDVQTEIAGKLKETISLRFRVLYESIDDANVGKLKQFLSNVNKGQVLMNEFNDLSLQMDREEEQVLRRRLILQSLSEGRVPRYLMLIMFISCVCLIASFLIISRAFRRQTEYQDILENKIKELNASNAEIEQIAFVASHDLQEPLRKIRTFSDRLLSHHDGELKGDSLRMLTKMSVASQRMQELLNDLINYTRLNKNDEKLRQVDLKPLIEHVCNDLRKPINAKGATIQIGVLPAIDGYYKQLYLLFYNLIDNAIKFSKPDTTPVINIFAAYNTANEVPDSNRYVRISVSDNGIGFNKDFAQKIFIIFQRLHTQQSHLPGKGIGLAICKRIMLNHKGTITANGETGIGARFNLYFPKPNA